jgi:hypothetical protein
MTLLLSYSTLEACRLFNLQSLHQSLPINKNDFDKGHSEDPLINKIQKFLESNKDKALPEGEIMGYLYPDHISQPGNTITFGSAMLSWHTQERSN